MPAIFLTHRMRACMRVSFKHENVLILSVADHVSSLAWGCLHASHRVRTPRYAFVVCLPYICIPHHCATNLPPAHSCVNYRFDAGPFPFSLYFPQAHKHTHTQSIRCRTYRTCRTNGLGKSLSVSAQWFLFWFCVKLHISQVRAVSSASRENWVGRWPCDNRFK